MTGTKAVPSEHLAMVARRNGSIASSGPLCPVCSVGQLHPYRVTISLSDGIRPYDNADYLESWVAVCRGNRTYWETLGESERAEVSIAPPYGFSLPMTPHLWPNRPAREIDPLRGAL